MRCFWQHIALIGVLCGFFVTQLQAQDPNFSLNYANPVTVNPAMAGLMEGDYRFNAAHRWRRATATQDYHTSLLSADMRIDNRLMEGGLNLLVATDEVPGLRTNNAQLTFAYEAPLGTKVRYHHLRAGFQAGIIQRSLLTDDFFYEDQFDGLGFNLPTSEAYPNLSIISPDVSAGVLWYRTQKIVGNPEFNPFAGFSIQHLNRPQLGFYERGREKANMRYTVQAGGKIRTRTPFDINFNGVYALQNHSQQLTFNLFARYVFYENGITFGRHKASVMLGGVYRPGDAVIGYAGFEFKKTFSFGMAFDFYTADDPFTRNTYGGLHMMASYNIGFNKYRGSALPFPFF